MEPLFHAMRAITLDVTGSYENRNPDISLCVQLRGDVADLRHAGVLALDGT
jgi:hypothetical protein